MNIQPPNSQIDSIFMRYTKQGSPGCALAVMKDGEVVYQQGYGLANLEHSVPVLPSTVFNIGSMAKQFTAFAIALLEAEGRLSLDDDFRMYLPEMHEFGHTITLRHLIHHTSGLRCTFPELLALAEGATPIRPLPGCLLATQGHRELNFPGEEFMYANSNYILLALICERVSEQSLAAFCQERMFSPSRDDPYLHQRLNCKIIPSRFLGLLRRWGWKPAQRTIDWTQSSVQRTCILQSKTHKVG
jgi:CubicO group peptidase (beta-lactamase class C family)